MRLKSFFAVLLVGLIVLGSTPQTYGSVTPTGTTKVYLPLVRLPLVLEASLNAPIDWASHLGGAGADQGYAVEVSAQEVVLWGGALTADPAGATRIDLLGGGAGAVLVRNPDGSLRHVIHIGATNIADPVVYDLEIQGDQVVACGNWGVAVLNYLTGALVWSDNPGTVRRCALGTDGTVAAALLPNVIVYPAGGTPQTIDTGASGGDTNSFDVAVYAPNQSVIVTGYKQKSTNLQVAFLNAWNYAGAVVWSSYDFTNSEVSNAGLGADTRGRRVAVGEDGMLYFTGRADGSTAIFNRNPKNISQNATIVKTDRFTDPYNNSATIMWYGRYNPLTGELDRGQYILGRLSSGKGNAVVPLAIDADKAGNVYLAGDAACCLDQRDARTVASVPVGPYSSGEGFLLVVSSDLRTRYLWSPFAGPGVSAGGSPARAVAVRGGVVGLAMNLTSGRLITTPDAWQPNPSTLPDGYLMVWEQ